MQRLLVPVPGERSENVSDVVSLSREREREREREIERERRVVAGLRVCPGSEKCGLSRGGRRVFGF